MPSPKTPYADAPLIINRNQRKQLREIGMDPEPVVPEAAPPAPAPTPAPRKRQPTDWAKLEAEAERYRNRKR